MAESPELQSAASDAIAEDERRTHQRLPASSLAGIKAQLTTGPAVALKDVSRSGARFQSESRLLPGLSVALKMVTPDGVVAVRGRVVRSRLVRMDSGGMGYEAAVAFTDLLPDLASDAAPAPARKAPAAVSTTASSSFAHATTAAAVAAPVVHGAAESMAAARPASAFAGLADDAAPALRTAAQAQPHVDAEVGAADGSSVDAAGATSDDDLPMMMLLTASVSQTTAELHEMFNGNDW